MATFLPLLVLLGLGSVAALGHPRSCSPTERLHDGEVKTIVANNTINKTEITAEVEVYPHEGFQGVSLEVEDGNGTLLEAWFPNDTCWQWDNEWRKLEVEVQKSIDALHPGIIFLLSIDKCRLWCRKNGNYRSLQRLKVVGRGSSGWRLNSSVPCATPAKYQHKSRSLSSCVKPPPPKVSTTPSPHPHSPTPHGGTDTSATPAVVVVAWVVGMVTMVTIVLVTVMVVWQIWRQESAPPLVIKDRLHSAQPSSLEDGAATAGHRGFLHVSINSLYEPFSQPDNNQ